MVNLAPGSPLDPWLSGLFKIVPDTGGGSPDASGTILGSDVDGSSSDVYSFTGKTLGAADSTRYIGVAVVKRDSTEVVIGVTVAGVTATEIVDTGGTSAVSIWWAAVPTGTTGTIEVTFDASTTRCGIGWCRSLNVAATATATATGGVSSTLNLDLNTTAGGFVFAACTATSGPTVSWAGVTEGYEETIEGDLIQSGAAQETASASTPLTVTATLTGSANQAGCAASFAKA
ncbi:MAG: hypothetical protein NXI13_16370 [Proteobacteria bacterium]|nr:hypothetical protein [Pseudomonadota bacterium]